jgi:O-antigen/teichoic acid export membrane protein
MIGKRAAGRVFWGVADQALSSATNFALAIVVARAVAPAAFGTFALVFATYLLILGISRAINTQPLVVRFSDVEAGSWREASREATGAAIWLGVVAGTASAVIGVILASPALVFMGLMFPGLLLQDAWRMAFFARGSGRSAFVNDLVWAVALVPALWITVQIDSSSAAPFVLAWGCSATVAAVAGVAQSRIVPALSVARTVGWQRAHRDLAPRFLGEFLALSASNQLLLYGVTGISGLVAGGAIRAGQVLLGPLHVIQGGAWLVALPEQVRSVRRGKRRFVALSVALSGALGLAALGYGVLVILVPDELGRTLFGPTWANAADVVLPLALANIGIGLWMGAVLGLRAMEQARRSFRARLISSPLTVVGGVVGALLGDAPGAAWGVAIATAIGLPTWWLAFRRAVLERWPSDPGPREPSEEGVTKAARPGVTAG